MFLSIYFIVSLYICAPNYSPGCHVNSNEVQLSCQQLISREGFLPHHFSFTRGATVQLNRFTSQHPLNTLEQFCVALGNIDSVTFFKFSKRKRSFQSRRCNGSYCVRDTQVYFFSNHVRVVLLPRVYSFKVWVLVVLFVLHEILFNCLRLFTLHFV